MTRRLPPISQFCDIPLPRDVLQTFIAKVIKLRQEQGLDQIKLAYWMGTTQSTISRFEQGRTMPTLSFLLRLAKVLNAKLKIELLED